jgi:hypothetical protein
MTKPWYEPSRGCCPNRPMMDPSLNLVMIYFEICICKKSAVINNYIITIFLQKANKNKVFQQYLTEVPTKYHTQVLTTYYLIYHDHQMH